MDKNKKFDKSRMAALKKIDFFIPGPLPGLNEIIASSKKRIPWLSRGKKQVYEYSKMKREWTDRVATHFLEQHKRPERPFQNPVEISFLFIEPNRRRDPDNIFAGCKFILDSLVKVGVLQADSQKYVKSISCSIGPNDKNKPCVFIVIKEVFCQRCDNDICLIGKYIIDNQKIQETSS